MLKPKKFIKNATSFDTNIINNLYIGMPKDQFSVVLNHLLKSIEDVDSWINQKGCTELKNLIHSLKGNSASLWAMKLSEICKKIEKLCLDNNIPWINDLRIQCKTELNLVKHDIYTILSKI